VGHFKKILAIGGVATIVFLVLSACQQQPSYQGRPLSRLLRAYEIASDAGNVTEAETIPLRSIGTNAVAWLLRWLDNDTPDWKAWFLDRCNIMICRVSPKWVFDDTSLNRQCRVEYGFRVLGTNAAFAVPELARRLLGSNDLASFHAARSLAFLGPPGWPVLVTALTNRDEKLWENVCLALQDIDTNAAPAVPIIVSYVGDPDPAFRLRAAQALNRLPFEPTIAVPALIKTLDDQDVSICQSAISALGGYESDAIQAFPRLVELLKDPVPYTRLLAGNALRRIDLEASMRVPQ
jgi:hypothetical protein